MVLYCGLGVGVEVRCKTALEGPRPEIASSLGLELEALIAAAISTSALISSGSDIVDD